MKTILKHKTKLFAVLLTALMLLAAVFVVSFGSFGGITAKAHTNENQSGSAGEIRFAFQLPGSFNTSQNTVEFNLIDAANKESQSRIYPVMDSGNSYFSAIYSGVWGTGSWYANPGLVLSFLDMYCIINPYEVFIPIGTYYVSVNVNWLGGSGFKSDVFQITIEHVYSIIGGCDLPDPDFDITVTGAGIDSVFTITPNMALKLEDNFLSFGFSLYNSLGVGDACNVYGKGPFLTNSDYLFEEYTISLVEMWQVLHVFELTIPVSVYEIEFYINFFDYNKNVSKEITVTVTTDVPLVTDFPPDPEPPLGYRFLWWCTDAELNNVYLPGEPYSVLYPKYSLIYYSFTFNYENVLPINFTIERSKITLMPISRLGRDFVGWACGEQIYEYGTYDVSELIAGNPEFLNAEISASVALDPVWETINYTITYELDGGSISGAVTNYTIDSPTITLPTPTRAGCIFGGWYQFDDFVLPIESIPQGSFGDKTIYAKWTLIVYTIAYNANGGTITGAVTSYNVESEVTLIIPTKTGYKFNGWYESENLTGSTVTAIPVGSMGDRTFYAKWEVAFFVVTFYVNNFEYKTLTVRHGTKLNNLAFIYLATTSNAVFSIKPIMSPDNALYDMSTPVTDNLSLYTIAEFSICAVLELSVVGQIINNYYYEYNAQVGNLTTPEKDGLFFVGWYYDLAFTQKVNSNDKLTENKTIYAKMTFYGEGEGEETPAWSWKSWLVVGVGAIIILALIIGVLKIFKRGKKSRKRGRSI